MRSGLAVYDKHVAFWGSAFSNFYPTHFELDGKKWKTSEQYFMWRKAMEFNDLETAKKIECESDPRICKKLGRGIQNYDDAVWSNVRESVMYKAVYAKFSQNETLKDFILSSEFEGKSFVEGSPYDGVWGVKVQYSDPRVDDENNWQGENLLGKVLDRVRDILKDGII